MTTTTITTTQQAEDLFRAPPDRMIDVGAGAVAYRRIGSGPDILFVHGWPVSGATYRYLLPHMSEHCTCHVLDLVGTGNSKIDSGNPPSIALHIEAVRRVVDVLELTDFTVVGHDSGGMIARHALAGDPRVRAFGLINTEQSQGINFRFRLFLWFSRIPGFAWILSILVMIRFLRRNPLLLGDAFADRDRLDGTFEEFFLAPLRSDADRRWAAGTLIKSFETRYVNELGQLHEKIDVPVKLVWGEDDPFFPVEWAREMVGDFDDASITVVPDAKLFVHEERPAEVATALLEVALGDHA
jgi:pimeloyl-ACP methyl ester carboxylesterase